MGLSARVLTYSSLRVGPCKCDTTCHRGYRWQPCPRKELGATLDVLFPLALKEPVSKGWWNTCFCGMPMLKPCPYTLYPHRNDLSHPLTGTAFLEGSIGPSCLVKAKNEITDENSKNKQAIPLKCFAQNSDARGFSRLSISFVPEACCSIG